MFFLADNISLSRPKMKLLAYSIQFIFQLSMFVLLLCKSWGILLMMKNCHFFKELGSEQAKSHLLHLFRFVFTMRFQMCPQMVCPKRGKVTFVAFDWLFSTMGCQMSPQIVCPRRGKVTLVAFIGLFSTVPFQMSPQITCLRRGKVTMVAFVWLFSTMLFQMSPQTAYMRRHIVTLIAFVWLFSTVYFQVIL